MSNSQIPVSDILWRTAAACNNGACIQVAAVDGAVMMRDSKDPNGPVLHYTEAEWLVFLSGAKDGDFDDLIGTGQQST